MRVLALLALALSTALAGILPAGAETGETAAQSLFLGQRLCGDTRDICYVTTLFVTHPYLHVVVHSVPDDTDWRIQAGPNCASPMRDVGGRVPVPSSGYAEAVIDLASGDAPLFQRPACFAFRGHNHFYVNFYAAYLDDQPQVDAEAVYPGYEHLAGRPDLPDLDIEYIHRTPSFPYDATPNQPAVGEPVTFTAHILNAGGVVAVPAPYIWRIDGKTVSSGTLTASLEPGEQTTLDLPWKWDPRPHTVELQLFPIGPEISAANDVLSIRSDGLALGFWIEQGAWQYFQERQWQYCSSLSCTGSDSFPDWLQRQVSVWNGMLAAASYDLPTRTTVADRVRVDEITVAPDGALPLHGGQATNTPDSADRTVDLEWGLPTAGVERTYRDANDGPFNVDLGLLHELSHARSLSDLYRFDLALDGGSTVDVLDESGRAAFDPVHPFDGSRPLHAFYSDAAAPYLYADAENDLMSCACSAFYAPYDAILLNRLSGRRARCGNSNPPCNLGDWFGDLPPVTRLRLVVRRGVPVPATARVRLFFDSGQGYNDHRFLQSDRLPLPFANGVVVLPPDPFRSGGNMSRAAHNLLLVEVATPSRDAFCFIEPAPLNMAYWTGYDDAAHPATLTLNLAAIRRNACNLALPRPRINDPFATSPWRSAVTVGPATRGRVVRVVLRSDSVPSGPAMQNRLVRVLGPRGRVLAQGTTDAAGAVRLVVARTPNRIVDVSDNDLVIPLARAAPQRGAAQRP